MSTKQVLHGDGRRSCSVSVKAATDPGVYRWTISTNVIDDDGEVMVPRGCNFRDFVRQGGGMYWQHNPSEYPIGKCVGVKLFDEVEAEVMFPVRPLSLPESESWGPDYMRALVDAEMVNAVSVGFSRLEGGSRAATGGDKARYGDDVRRVTNKWKLREVSFTTTPINAEALRKAFDSRGLSLAGAKSVLRGLKVDTAHKLEPVVHRLRVIVPERGHLDRLEVEAAKAIAKLRGRVYWH